MEGFSDGSSTLPASTSSSQASYRLRRAFSFYCKAHRALILLLLAPKPDPLSLGSGLGSPLRGVFSYRKEISILTALSKKKDMTKGHVFLFGFQPPKAASTLRYLNARGRQSRPISALSAVASRRLRSETRLRAQCAVPGLWPGTYAPFGTRPRRAVGRFSCNGPVNPKYQF